MAQFAWTKDLYTRNALIDGDHARLVELVNAFIASMENGESNERMVGAMGDLIACAGEHFGREEAEMERIAYVAALAHQAEHSKLLRQLVELKDMLEAGGKINVPALSDFLGIWLRDHILAADMKLAAALKRYRPESTRQLH